MSSLFQEILGEGNAADMSNLNFSSKIFNTKERWVVDGIIFLKMNE